MLDDITISKQANLLNILEISKNLGIDEKFLEQYGKIKGKINFHLLNNLKSKKDGKLILVTAINPTPAGEGKTTTTIGLGDSLKKLNQNVVICLREPSLGPVFGVKGGATGGGYSQVAPMEEINLHFTGDFHAISSANNLLAATIDNHIFHGNELNINSKTITFKRVLDMNDRQLRSIVSGLTTFGWNNGVPREEGFDITVASEIMAIFCLAIDLEDLKNKLEKIVIGYNFNNQPVTCKDLEVAGALTVLLKEAFNPNLVQTLENTPTIIHGGPFANIAHGCNSLIGTKLGLKLGDIVVTEAGFGADLGAEKFFDIKCRLGNLKPNGTVLVATVRALKLNGGANKNNLATENLSALKKGIVNLVKHIKNITEIYNLKTVVAINKFPTDTKSELNFIIETCNNLNIPVSISEVFEKGSEGGIDLGKKVLAMLENENNFSFAYDLNNSILEKIEQIAKKIYGASKIILSSKAKSEIKKLENLGYSDFPICIAKTQYSFSDNPKLLGAPENFEFNIKDIKLSAGAGFIVALSGDVMTMPGLPKIPASKNISLNEDNEIIGLF